MTSFERLWIILLSSASRRHWRLVEGGGGGVSWTCQHPGKDAAEAFFHRTRQPLHARRRGKDGPKKKLPKKISETVQQVARRGRGNEARSVISMHSSTLMCVSSNYLLAPELRLKITSPSRQLIKCRISRSDWFSLNCRSESSSKVLTLKKESERKKGKKNDNFFNTLQKHPRSCARLGNQKTSVKISMKRKLSRVLEVKSLGSVSSPHTHRLFHSDWSRPPRPSRSSG